MLMNRRDFGKTFIALAGCMALAPTPSLSHILSQQETEEQKHLRWVIKNLEEFNELVCEYAEREDKLKLEAYFGSLIRESLMPTILGYTSPTSSIYQQYNKIKDQENVDSSQILTKTFRDYFLENDMYFHAGWTTVGNDLFPSIKLYNLVSEELIRKYSLHEIEEIFNEDLFNHWVDMRTIFLGKPIIGMASEHLGLIDEENIILNTERLDYKVEREFQAYSNPNLDTIQNRMNNKSWEDLESNSPDMAKKIRGQRIIRSIQYHEAAHGVLDGTLGLPLFGIHDEEYFTLRVHHDEAIALLSELIYGKSWYSKLVDIAEQGQTNEGFRSSVCEVILRGIEEYYMNNINMFKGHNPSTMILGFRQYKLPELYKLNGEQIKEIAETILDENYRNPAVEGQPHYETRKIYSPIFRN